jgi:hypothetical protein
MDTVPKIVRERLQAAPQPEQHPDANLLTAFAEKSLTQREQAQILDHLALCADCREIVALALPEADSLKVAVAARAAAALATPVTYARAQRPRWQMLSWAALAACVLVVGGVIIRNNQKKTATPVAVTAQQEPAIVAQQTTQESRAEGSVDKAQNPITKLEKETTAREASSAVGARKFDDLLARDTQKKTVFGGGIDIRNGVPATSSFVKAAPAPAPPAPSIVVDAAAPPVAVGAPLQQNVSNLPTNGRNVFDLQASAKEKDADKNRNQIADAKAPLAYQTSQSVEVSGATPVVLNENVASVNENVTVETSPAKPSSQQNSAGLLKVSPGVAQEQKTQASAAGGVGQAANSLATRQENYAEADRAHLRSFVRFPDPRWSLSQDGKLMRSDNLGEVWQSVSVADVVFRAICVRGSDIWVGGIAGALYYSADKGSTWQQIKPTANGHVLTDDIATIDFTDEQHGTLVTLNSQVWTTPDGGKSWQTAHPVKVSESQGNKKHDKK